VVARRPQKKAKPRPTEPRGPSELELIEQEVAAREQEVADLERRLSEDWNDTEVARAHAHAREELMNLLGRWEELFERSQTS
jgi:hypothetical protein